MNINRVIIETALRYNIGFESKIFNKPQWYNRWFCAHELVADTQLKIVVCKKCYKSFSYEIEDLERNGLLKKAWN